MIPSLCFSQSVSPNLFLLKFLKTLQNFRLERCWAKMRFPSFFLKLLKTITGHTQYVLENIPFRV